jgi:hypothetical protein
MRDRFLLLLLLLSLASFPASCAWLQEHAAKPAPALLATNATAAELPSLPAFPAESESPKNVLESDLNEPNPPGTKQKFGKREAGAEAGKSAGKTAAKAPAGKSSDQCYKKTPKSKKSRCEPQCIPYARCRTGVDSCRLGRENNSLTWFACEKKRKSTTDEPGPGMVMILLANARRNMPTGHALVVEKATPQGKDAWLLIVSHANWDTHCGLETGAKVLYNRKTMKAAFLSGEWKDWASDLAVAGFIEK